MQEFLGTVVGLRYRDGLALASDSRSTSRYLVTSKRARKIFEIEENIGAAIAGLGGDVQNIAYNLRAQANLYRIRREKRVSPESLAQFASNLLNAYRTLPYVVSIVFAGVGDNGSRLYFLDSMGGKLEEKRFAAAGTGATVAYGVLEQNYNEDMESKDGLKLAAQSIKQAIERDAATGDRVLVAKVDEEGYEELSEDEIEELLK